MDYRGDCGESFAVCDFCDADRRERKFVCAVGQKGICNECAMAFAVAIALVKTETK